MGTMVKWEANEAAPVPAAEPDHCAGRPLGPRGQARRRALLDAAARLFAAKGYEKTTLSDLVTAAGGSRATVYELFGDKAGLFRAMMEESNNRILEHLPAGRSAEAARPDEALERLAMHFVNGILNDDARAVVRVLISESGRFPDIAEAFWRSGPASAVDRVADYLRTLADGNRLRVDDPAAAAQAFMGMVVGELFMRGLILPGQPVPDGEVERRVRYAVRLFLDGIRGTASAAGGDARPTETAAVSGRS